MGQKQILVVEDDLSTQRLISTIIKRENHLVMTASDGREAASLIQTGKFDLVICDETMPHLRGSQFAEWLRTREESRLIPVILLSAEENPSFFGGLLTRGIIDAFLPKPFQFIQLSRLIQTLLELKRLPSGHRTDAAQPTGNQTAAAKNLTASISEKGE